MNQQSNDRLTLLENEAKRLEEKAELTEKEAEIRERIAEAKRKIKEHQPDNYFLSLWAKMPGGGKILLGLAVLVVVIIVMAKAC